MDERIGIENWIYTKRVGSAQGHQLKLTCHFLRKNLSLRRLQAPNLHLHLFDQVLCLNGASEEESEGERDKERRLEVTGALMPLVVYNWDQLCGLVDPFFSGEI